MSLICEYIIDENDRRIIRKYIKRNKLGREAERFFEQNIDKFFRRRRYLLSVISEYLISNTKINIDGFIKFRLREYNRLLEAALKTTKEEYFKYTEYQVFIEILKEIVRNQNRMVRDLNIKICDEGYFIYDENNEFLNERCIKILNEEFEYNFDYSDEFLLSAVITLAPEKIYVINPGEIKNRRLFETIKNIYCENCYI